jgi:hypothetical protein
LFVEDLVDYTLRFSATYDSYNPYNDDTVNGYGSAYCGPGQRSGLVASFMSTDLRQIPHQQMVEVPFSVSLGYNSLCVTYTDIRLEIVATCEIPTSESQVYQYGVHLNPNTNEVSILYNTRIYASNASATFNVEWPLPGSRRMSEYSDTDELTQDNHNANSSSIRHIRQLEEKLSQQKKVHEELLSSRLNELYIVLVFMFLFMFGATWILIIFALRSISARLDASAVGVHERKQPV